MPTSPKPAPDHQRHAGLMRLASTASVLVALILIGAKGWASWQTDSMSILASLIDSSVDALASLLNFFAIRYALTPADAEHRYGHGKAESLAGLAQSLFIIGSATFLLVQTFLHAKEKQVVEHAELGMAVMVLSLALTISLVAIQKYVIKHTRSTAIEADSLHYVGDVMMNLAVIGALYFASIGFHDFDIWAAIVIAAFLLHSAWQIVQKSFNYLLDHEIADEQKQRIIALIEADPRIEGYHDLRTRESGIQQFIQMHIELEATMPFHDAHAVADQLEKAIMREFPRADVIIHPDPV